MSSAYSHQRAKRVNARADQRLGHRSPEDRVRYRNEGEDSSECCQNNGSCPLHDRFDDGIVVIQTGRSFSLICSVRIRVLCMKMPANPIKPRMASKPKGWLKTKQHRNHAGKPLRPCRHHYRHRRQAADLKNDDDEHGSDDGRENLYQRDIRLERFLDTAAHFDAVTDGKRSDQWLKGLEYLLRHFRRLGCLAYARADGDDGRAVVASAPQYQDICYPAQLCQQIRQYPPVRKILSPVMKLQASDDRKMAAPTISSGCPARPIQFSVRT